MKITRLPTGTAMHGWSPQQRETAIAPTEFYDNHIALPVSDIDARGALDKYAIKNNIGRARGIATNQAKARAKLDMIRRNLAAGKTALDIAHAEVWSVEWTQKLIRRATR